MTDRPNAHEAVAWAKQRLDDVDTIVSKGEAIAGGLRESSQKAAEQALVHLRDSRARLQHYYEELRASGEATKRDVAEAQRALETEWIEVESAFQAFLLAAGEEAGAVRDIVVARAKAQRCAWEASLNEFHQQAAEIIEQRRVELDAAIQRLSDEIERLQGRIGNARDAGDSALSALREGLADARAVHGRTIEKIKEAISKLF